uniref:Threonylcarbamoyl-AMP synthase n=1 Tax=Alexandrium monilatum TaxID=311494 RepID=A0A7S4QD06_9DINO
MVTAVAAAASSASGLAMLATSRAFPRRTSATRRKASRASREPAPYVDLEELLLSEPLGPLQERQLAPAVDALFGGGMGVIPTDTQHAYVTSINSRKGTRRIYAAKGLPADEWKPLSLLCADLSMASRFCDMGSLPRRWYQCLRQCLPGPYTFILRASSEVPRVVLEHKSRRRLWQRREVGIRVPDCAVVHYLTSELDEPLLASSACGEPSAIWDTERHNLDFIVAGVSLSSLWDDLADDDRVSTIIDLTMEEPVLRRQGMGDASMFLGEEEHVVPY